MKKRTMKLFISALCIISFHANLFAVDHDKDNVKIVVIGDSTVCEYPEENPNRGWGHYLSDYFKENVTIINLAKSGRSTKTFIKEKRWEKALNEKPDYVLIQFGHNDSHSLDKPESTNSESDYRDYLRQYVKDSRGIHAVPIFITPMHRRTFHPDGTLNDNLKPYALAMKAIAKEMDVAVVDLHTSSGKLFLELGDKKSMELASAPTDRTHFNAKGAKKMAELVMKELSLILPIDLLK